MTTDKPIAYDAYERLAEAYNAAVDTKPHNAYYDRPAVLSLLPAVEGIRALDASSGTGRYTQWLLENNAAHVTGVEVSPAMMAQAHQRLREHIGETYVERTDLRLHDLREPMPFLADGSIDLVISPLTLDYLPDWNPIMREFFRVLRPGGVFVASFAHPLGDYMLIESKKYFEVEQFDYPWRGFGGEVVMMRSYRRPFGAAINPILQSGLILDTLLEPLPTEEFKQADPMRYERLFWRPGFLCVRAHKPGA